MTNAWVIRAGSRGEHEQWNLKSGRATIGWAPIGDLSETSSRDQVRSLVEVTFAKEPAGTKNSHTSQLWAFRDSIQPGDLIVMPLKSQPGYLAFGRCTGPYGYDSTSELHRRHYIPVEWQSEHVSRTNLKSDLLAKVNIPRTVSSPSLNNAATRLAHVAAGHPDPGIGAMLKQPPADSASLDDGVADPPLAPTLDDIRDRIRTRLAQDFREHELTRLVADILQAIGYICEVSSAGPDGGIDIRAGRGPLGLDSPTIVEVKSEPGPVGVTVLSRLHSAMGRTGAAQGLLVAMGGLNGPARKEHEHLRSTIQVWDSEALLNRLFETYPRLPEATRAALPLKQAWVLDDESEG